MFQTAVIHQPWIVGALGVGAGLGLVMAWNNAIWANRYRLAPQLFGRPVFRVNTATAAIALTFDDGPDPRYTPAVLDVLKRHGARATFFVVGTAAQAHPDILQRIIHEGHAIGNHSWRHHSLNFKGPRAIRQEILRTDRLIRDLGYRGEIPFRPPYGHNLLFLTPVLRQLGRSLFFWDVEITDLERRSPQQILARLHRQMQPGSIVLLHDGCANPPRGGDIDLSPVPLVLELLLATYERRGLEFTTLPELLHQPTCGVTRPV